MANFGPRGRFGHAKLLILIASIGNEFLSQEQIVGFDELFPVDIYAEINLLRHWRSLGTAFQSSKFQ